MRAATAAVSAPLSSRNKIEGMIKKSWLNAAGDAGNSTFRHWSAGKTREIRLPRRGYLTTVMPLSFQLSRPSLSMRKSMRGRLRRKS